MITYQPGYDSASKSKEENLKPALERKRFDPTVCFTFYGTWVESLRTIEELQGADEAFYVFKAIANKAMYDEEPAFNELPEMRMLWPNIRRDIENSVNRRKSQFAADELNENHQKIRKMLTENPRRSHRQIAAELPVSPSTVDRVYRKYSKKDDEDD